MDREKKIPITEKMLTFENVGIEKLVWPRLVFVVSQIQ